MIDLKNICFQYCGPKYEAIKILEGIGAPLTQANIANVGHNLEILLKNTEQLLIKLYDVKRKNNDELHGA